MHFYYWFTVSIQLDVVVVNFEELVTIDVVNSVLHYLQSLFSFINNP